METIEKLREEVRKEYLNKAMSYLRELFSAASDCLNDDDFEGYGHVYHKMLHFAEFVFELDMIDFGLYKDLLGAIRDGALPE